MLSINFLFLLKEILKKNIMKQKEDILKGYLVKTEMKNQEEIFMYHILFLWL